MALLRQSHSVLTFLVFLPAKGKGITFDPAKFLVKAGDKPDVQLMITVPTNAALGEYKVSVKGTPTTGEPTSTVFNVKVVTP